MPVKMNGEAEQLKLFIRANSKLVARDNVPGREYNNVLINAALNSLDADGWLAFWADDDYYGPTYLETLQAAIHTHPDAWLIGCAGYWTRWVDGPHAGRELWEQPVNVGADDRTSWFAGTTICLSARMWRENFKARFPSGTTNSPDGEFIQNCAAAWKMTNPIDPVPFYNMAADFKLLRYSDPKHAHDWCDPRDRQ